MLSIIELLKLRGLDTTAKIKMLRHQDKRYNIKTIIENNYLEIYQSFQSKPILDCDYVVSFIGDESSKAIFYGVYKVINKQNANEVNLPKEFPYPEFKDNDGFYYTLEEITGFEDYKERVIIDWGKAALAWHQYLSDKEVLEILPKGYVKEFPGFLDFILSYQELKKIINNPDSNREWFRMLSSTDGIYLIVDKLTGLQYVGSAYGKEGIWGRWSNYAQNGHGNNELLLKLLEEKPDYCNNFMYSILQTIPNLLNKEEVIQKESFFKEKLGSRAFGLNKN